MMTPDPADIPAGPDRLLALLAEGRVTRGRWTGTDALGRRTLCALSALSDEVASAESAYACPAELMPSWVAHVVPWMDDATSPEARGGILLRLGELAGRWGVLDGAAWESVRVGWLADDVLPEALSHVTTDEWGVRAAVERVRAALRSGDAEELWAAGDAAGAARAAAWDAAARAAGDAAWDAAARAAARDAGAAARAARAAWAAGDAAADRLSAALLDRIEGAITAAGGAA